MLKLYTLFVSAILFLNVSILDEVRTNYNKLAADKALCKKNDFGTRGNKRQFGHPIGLFGRFANHLGKSHIESVEQAQYI